MEHAGHIYALASPGLLIMLSCSSEQWYTIHQCRWYPIPNVLASMKLIHIFRLFNESAKYIQCSHP